MVKEKRQKTEAIMAPLVMSEDTGEDDIYEKVVDYEEKEALNRTSEEDRNLVFNTCQSLREILAEMIELRNKGIAENKSSISDKCIEACVLVTVLKKLNRLEKIRLIKSRDEVNAEKLKVDSINLQYQNLLYEAGHIMSEYAKCSQFKSKDQDIELVPVEDFLKTAPDSVKQKFEDTILTNDAKHIRHIARLEHELQERKQLAQMSKDLENQKKQLSKDIMNKKNKLELLKPRLKTVLEVTKPIQEQLGIPFEKIHKEHKGALLLPGPLYYLYFYADAYQQLYLSDIVLEILGDLDEAQQWKEQHNGIPNYEDSEQENEQEFEEVVEVVKKRRHRKSFIIDRHEEKKKKLLSPHPLSIKITVKCNNGISLAVKFTYRYFLNIITVTSKSNYPENFTSFTAKEVLNGDNLLSTLFEDDYGAESPNSANDYQLKKVKVECFTLLVVELGYAYQWAQRLCGMDFLSKNNEKNFSNQLSQTTVKLVFKKIMKRLNSHGALAAQFQQLESNIIPSIPDNFAVPQTTVTELSKFSSSSWMDFIEIPSASFVMKNKLISPADYYFEATLKRNEASLLASIIIKNNYPHSTPIFALLVTRDNLEFHSSNSDDVRDMERSVNVGWKGDNSNAPWLLAAQLKFLCAYFDVYLETTSSERAVQNVNILKSLSGRNRGKPFKFLKVGSGILTQ